MSSRSGLIETVSIPAAPSRAIQPRVRCGPGPPKEIWRFLGAIPPKLTISSVCCAMLRHSVACMPTGAAVPMM